MSCVNAEAAYTDDAKKGSREYLQKQALPHGNVALDPSSDGRSRYRKAPRAFPNHYMVIDQNGRLVGDPITGWLRQASKTANFKSALTRLLLSQSRL